MDITRGLIQGLNGTELGLDARAGAELGAARTEAHYSWAGCIGDWSLVQAGSHDTLHIFELRFPKVK